MITKYRTQQDKLVEFQEALSSKLHTAGMHAQGKMHETDQVFVPDDATSRLCESLIAEEANELGDELRNGTLAGVLKELCDVLYVVNRVAAIYDLPVAAAFNRVHDNNMAKIMKGTIREDGKLLKPADYVPVNLDDLLRDY